jgi:hypothetical protein
MVEKGITRMRSRSTYSGAGTNDWKGSWSSYSINDTVSDIAVGDAAWLELFENRWEVPIRVSGRLGTGSVLTVGS